MRKMIQLSNDDVAQMIEHSTLIRKEFDELEKDFKLHVKENRDSDGSLIGYLVFIDTNIERSK